MDKLTKIKNELQTIYNNITGGISDKKANFSPRMKESRHHFWQSLKERKEIVAITLLSIVLLALIMIVAIPRTKASIITKETNSLVGRNYQESNHVELIPYNKIEKAIVNNDSITVAIIDQHDENYDVLESVLNDEEKAVKFDGTVYLYPLVNEKDRVRSFFKIKDGITLIHFEDQKETARKVLSKKKDIEKNTFDYFKSMSMGKPAMTADELANEKLKEDQEAKGLTPDGEPKKTGEVIDELKDVII
ncbi:hypothetical protein G7081_05425 [Vagococcus coleopterorum]|uniref:Uncharacterized protein n=1 Tax=Vagococcus coleopterorum TaxID=2714946 RepID=A0A6G8ANQ1_9ENTE|nr:hypothetical protein [Vagococcus coleopterorum]QIL46553.1 hypothetical protein G7081_05425 [Vagococcus coleopterorum]